MKPSALYIYHRERRYRVEIVNCGRVNYTTYGCTWHNHAIYHLLLVSKGRHYLDGANGKSELIARNTLLLINPNIKHQIRQIAQEGFEHTGLLWRFIEDNGECAEFPLQELLGNNKNPHNGIESVRLSQKEAYNLMDQCRIFLELMKLKPESSCWEFKFFHLFYTLLEHIAYQNRSDRRENEAQNHLVDAVEQLLLQNFSNPHLNIPIIAEKLGRSPNFLNSLYRKHSGYTIGVSLRQKRIDRAKALLLESNLQIQEIANQCGFSNAGYLTRSFAQHQGITPLRFRQKKRERSEVYICNVGQVILPDYLSPPTPKS